MHFSAAINSFIILLPITTITIITIIFYLHIAIATHGTGLMNYICNGYMQLFGKYTFETLIYLLVHKFHSNLQMLKLIQ